MANASKLEFSILTQRIPGPTEGSFRWLATCATTGQVGLGTTEDISIERLFAGIMGLMIVAGEVDGVSPEAWLAANRACEPHAVYEFEQMEKEGRVEDLPRIEGPTGIRLQARKGRQPALA